MPENKLNNAPTEPTRMQVVEEKLAQLHDSHAQRRAAKDAKQKAKKDAS